ncbi:hypothetical protein OIE13_17010 [Streptosporangium sp. NBC_01810]|uniref:hypothetical protein n=1 Tax=Streptosporangium sp. NBC_01810 TaxID=2975951 RepID=UPI002DDAE67B|nr:hypothetical protein [Streptosporangium sp. NBC_01810]WSA29427.1 hypothetical protein OIE13_17010 [Streptosporangium sp. NBC_01810]
MTEQASPTAGTPARGYTWPPFEPGHTLSTKHAAYSPRRVDPLAAELVDQALADDAIPYLRQPSYRPALWAWGRAEARVQLLAEHLAEHEAGGCRGCDKCARWDEQLRKWESAAGTHRGRLGLDPASRARLGKDTASAQVDMARLLSGLDSEGSTDDRP